MCPYKADKMIKEANIIIRANRAKLIEAGKPWLERELKRLSQDKEK